MHVTATPVTAGGAKSSTMTKTTEELLLCQLCSLKYSVDRRRPMALRCVHTFCEVCLQQLLSDQMNDSDVSKSQKQRRTKRQQLVCPTCETVTPLGKGCTASSLHVNPSIMHLLEVFDRQTPGAPNETASGYSQVKVTTATSDAQRPTVNGLTSQERNNSPASASKMRIKKNGRFGLDPASDFLHGDWNADETGGGTANNAKWVSTVNIGNLASQPQQKPQNDAFLATKPSSAPVAVTSAVTSVSTLKKQSSSTSSPDAVSAPDSRAVRTSIAPRAADMCCRCSKRPATVSVASSSRTTAPQKLCSDCSSQPRRNSDEQQKQEAASAGAEQTMRITAGTNQPENFSIVVGKVVTMKADLRSASEAQTKGQTNAAANMQPQTVKDNSTVANSSKDCRSLIRDRKEAGSVAHGTSTIEVRRRSAYVNNQAHAAPTSTQEDGRSLTIDAAAAASTKSDQAVNSTNAHDHNASVGAKPRQTSETYVNRRSAIDITLPDTPPNSVPAAMPGVASASSGSNANTHRHCNSTELANQANDSSVRSSAPGIEEIHPLPCVNPPYNPDFDEDSRTTRSSNQHNQNAPNTSAASRPIPNPPGAEGHEQRQRMQQVRDISAATGKGVSVPFLLSNSRGQYPAEQPPKYEDIIREDVDVITATAPEAPAAPSLTQSVPATPPSEPVAAPVAMRLVRSFGKYGEISTQPGAFRAPRHISVSPATPKAATSTRVVVSDAANGTVQVFTETGECLSMLRAETVKGCCLLDYSQRLLLATTRGVEVSPTKTLPPNLT